MLLPGKILNSDILFNGNNISNNFESLIFI